jgi:hypothetical protein
MIFELPERHFYQRPNQRLSSGSITFVAMILNTLLEEAKQKQKSTKIHDIMQPLQFHAISAT